MPASVSGGWQPTSGFGYDRPYQDGIFVRSQFMDNLRIEERQNELKIIQAFGEKLGAGTGKPGERFMVPTQSNVAVGDVNDAITTSSFSFPDYIASDAPTFTNLSTFSKKATAGATVVGIPLPLQAANEGQIELLVNQYRGCAMIFTKRFVETAMGYIKNPTAAYSNKIKYALLNDIEEYCWLTWLYTGPLTATAADYGTGLNSFTDAIGITNRTNYALTRTLASINGASNLITPTVDGTPAAGMSNSGNARFPTFAVPFLFGSAASDITFDTLSRLEERFNTRNVPLAGRAIVAEPKGYSDIRFLPQFCNNDLSPGADVMRSGRIDGKVLTFDVHMTNSILPATSSNVNFELAGSKGCLLYEIPTDPELIIDNKLNKPEMCQIVMAACRYGAVIQRPDHTAVIQTRTRA